MTFIPASVALLTTLRGLLGAANVIESGESLAALSKDYYWYSPVLKRLLDDRLAAVAVRVSTLEELRGTLAACSRAQVPVVPRGAGTGNYGQCVPLHGGVVVELMRFDRILDLSADGVVRAEPGARLGTIEGEARRKGWELRCMPSTWVKSSLGGFFCGGSGGVGSITWGGVDAADNVKSVTLLSCEESPRLLRLEGRAAIKALRGYGATGVMVEIEMRLAPRQDYEQLVFAAERWDALLDWTDGAARHEDWRKRLVTQFEWPVPSYFKPLMKRFRPGENVSFLVIERGQAAAAVASAAAAGIRCAYQVPFTDPPKPPFITDYTFNHTTLWAMKGDPALTYLQTGFAANFRDQIRALQARFPDEILFHLEWGARQAKAGRAPGTFVGEDIGLEGLPLVRFRSEERLAEVIAYCAEIGVYVANPHTFVLEDGDNHANLGEKRALKADLDPAGLLNPGKMRTYPRNPFAVAPS